MFKFISKFESDGKDFFYCKNKRWSFYPYRMGIQKSMGKLPQKQVDQIMILSGGNNMLRKEYYVIQNEEGKFLKIDDLSGGYPCFIDDFEFCEKYESKEYAEKFLQGRYVTEMFKKEFDDCIIKTVVIAVE